MREILFRGFCPSKEGGQIITLDGEDIRGDWREGSLIQNKDASFIASQEKHSFVGYCYDCDRPFYDLHKVIPETVCQCTGLKDKDGKRTWEGDIVRFGDSTKMDKKGEIKYSAGAFLPIENGIGYTSWAIACEVIGDKFNTRSVE